MKRIAAILMVMILLLGLASTAFASDTAELNIDDPVTRTYNGYKLLNLSVSLKTGEHHPADCDGTHSDDCYNYAYTVNEKYRSLLQAEVFGNAGSTFWGADGAPADASAVTDVQILDYLEAQSGDNGDVYGSLRNVADRLYRAILAAGIAADIEGITGDSDVIDQGYWLFADASDMDGETDANSLVMLDTKGLSSITITPKTALPTVEKKVKDIEDSEDDSIHDNPWHDTADHDIGDTAIPFKLTGTLPANAQYYQSFTMIFHDTMSAGLTLNAGSVKVLMYESKYKADVDTDMNDAVKDVTEYFTVTAGTDCTFEVGCDNVFAISGVTKDTAFVVYYTATLNENAVFGSAGNPNSVYLEFSNDPYGTGTGHTEIDTVIVFTYQLIVNKTDSHGHALAGAGFTLYKKDVQGNYNIVGEEVIGEGMTTFNWKGLDDGDYKLVETTVPEGYNKMDDILFSISAEHSNDPNPALLSLDGGQMGTGAIDAGTITKAIENHTGTILPETGAGGTMMLVGGGTLFVILAAVFMITRKKMSVYEA